MKIIKSRFVYVTVLVIAIVLYAVGLLSLDYTFAGDGFSPFKSWTPMQTVYFAIVGFIFLSLLMLYDIQDRNTNLRSLIHIPPIIGLSFLILFSMDSRQVLQYLPFLQIFLFDDFGSLFLFGGLLGIYLTYLISVNLHNNKSTQNDLSEFGIRLISVVIFAPILLGTVFYLGISFCLSLGLGIFPFFGEGTIGSVLVASVLLGMYVTARILSYLEDNDLPSLKSIKPSQILKAIVESIAVYFCTVAGFSLVGGLVTDGIPTTELIPFSLVLLGFYAVIPFSVLLTRRKVFTNKEEMALPVANVML
jgi:hypothetical protein